MPLTSKMDTNVTKSGLAILLSHLDHFETPKVKAEQYTTPSEIAAEILWNAALRCEIQAKVSVDLGAGTGILGLGALILGAKTVHFVENDPSALAIARKNHKKVQKMVESEGSRAVFHHRDIATFTQKADIVLQNPPFGTKVRHADRVFLQKAMEISSIVYSFHKSETTAFVTAYARDNGFSVTHRWHYDFPIAISMPHHKKPVRKVKVSCFRLEKQKSEQ